MFQIRIPVNNTVEVVVCDLYLHVDVRILPLCPVQNMQAEVALKGINERLNKVAHEIAGEVATRLEATMKGEE